MDMDKQKISLSRTGLSDITIRTVGTRRLLHDKKTGQDNQGWKARRGQIGQN